MAPKFSQVRVALVGEDGNAFAILGRVREAMHQSHIASNEIEVFTKEAMSGDYDHLLQTVINTVSVEELDEEEDDTSCFDKKDECKE